jgi:hypothetical protein
VGIENVDLVDTTGTETRDTGCWTVWTGDPVSCSEDVWASIFAAIRDTDGLCKRDGGSGALVDVGVGRCKPGRATPEFLIGFKVENTGDGPESVLKVVGS